MQKYLHDFAILHIIYFLIHYVTKALKKLVHLKCVIFHPRYNPIIFNNKRF